ncbi:MAG: hypothetical protein ABIG61_16590 [Planctomycetota bacterium]
MTKVLTLKQIYEASIKVGAKYDWRGQEALDEIIAQAKRDADKPGFDKDRLFNPFGDTRIAFGDPDTKVKSILVGMDIFPTEILLAGQMNQIGKQVDLVLSHHTTCVNRGIFYYDDILLRHKNALAEIGVPKGKYDEAVEHWTATVRREWKMDTINTARNLDMPLFVVHTPCDVIHVKRTRDIFAQMKNAYLAEIVDELDRLKEIQLHPYEKIILYGDPKTKQGKVYNPVAGGWRPLINLFQLACEAGINTAVLVSPTEEYITMAQKYGVNIIEVPTVSQCNYGINIMIDELQKLAPLKIYEAQSFHRITPDQR